MGTLVDCARVAVVAMGNLLMKDDGVGIHALQALKRQRESNGVEWIDGGTDAWSAMWGARTCRHLLILDAIQGGEAHNVIPPAVVVKGTIRALTMDNLTQLKTRLEQMVQHVAQANRCEATVTFPGK